MKTLPQNDKSNFLTFRISTELRAELQKLAAIEDRSLGSLLRRIAAEYVEKEKKQ